MLLCFLLLTRSTGPHHHVEVSVIDGEGSMLFHASKCKGPCAGQLPRDGSAVSQLQVNGALRTNQHPHALPPLYRAHTGRFERKQALGRGQNTKAKLAIFLDFVRVISSDSKRITCDGEEPTICCRPPPSAPTVPAHALKTGRSACHLSRVLCCILCDVPSILG